MPFGVPYERDDAGVPIGLSDFQCGAASVGLEIETASSCEELLRDSHMPLFRCRVQRRVPVAGDKIDVAARCKGLRSRE